MKSVPRTQHKQTDEQRLREYDLQLAGQKYNRLIIRKTVWYSRSHVYVECDCICGSKTNAQLNNLRTGAVKSCGCFSTSVKYAPKTGLIYISGRPVTAKTRNGYLLTSYKGKKMYVHRLAWLLYYGSLPEKGIDIDHINRNRTDNRIENLRAVTRKENLANARKPAKAYEGKELEIMELWSQGRNRVEIANLIGISRHQVADFMKTQGNVERRRNSSIPLRDQGFCVDPKAAKRIQKDDCDPINNEDHIKMSMQTIAFSKQKKKTQVFNNIIGLTNSDYRLHLEKTFTERYGRPPSPNDATQIDHILPMNLAQTYGDLKILCHYTNLQLLTAEDNRRKSSRILTKFFPKDFNPLDILLRLSAPTDFNSTEEIKNG